MLLVSTFVSEYSSNAITVGGTQRNDIDDLYLRLLDGTTTRCVDIRICSYKTYVAVIDCRWVCGHMLKAMV